MRTRNTSHLIIIILLFIITLNNTYCVFCSFNSGPPHTHLQHSAVPDPRPDDDLCVGGHVEQGTGEGHAAGGAFGALLRRDRDETETRQTPDFKDELSRLTLD